MTETIVPITGAVPGSAELAAVRARAQTGIRLEALGTLAVLAVAFALPSLLVDRLLRLEWAFRAVLLASFVFVVVRTLQRRLVRPLAVSLDDDEIALAVERRAPDVKQALISSLQFGRELQPGVAGGAGDGSAALKAAVVADVRARIAAIPFGAAIDGARVRRFGWLLAGAIAAFAGWGAIDAGSLRTWALRNVLLTNVDWPRYTTLALAAGDAALVRLPQGDALTVRVTAHGEVPDQVFVDYAFRGGETGTEAMGRTGEAEFAWTLDAVLADVKLVIQGGDSLPLEVTVSIVERPRIDDLQIDVAWPAYMERDAETVPATQGELRLPRGARLSFRGKSQKDLDRAFLLFGNDERTELAVGADRRSFAGELQPSASGLLSVDVIDHDRLGAGTPPKLVLRVGDDRPPSVEFRLRGVGAAITAHARIPGDLKVKDDFGLRTVGAMSRAVVDKPPERGQEAPPEVPFAPALAAFTDPLVRSALRYETAATVDLLQWNKQPSEDAKDNPIRPGMLFSLRFVATDNFGPGDPHESSGETMVFRVVTREKLTEELRRRQVEQRQELQRITDDEQRALLELAEMVDPTAAGDRRRQVEARLRALARQQQSLGRRVAMVGELYQRILLEYENNRLWQASQVRQFEGLIPAPLAALAKEAFPASARLVDAFAATPEPAARSSAVDAYKDILRRLQAVLKQMEQAENLAALIEELRAVIKLENEAIQDVQGRVRAREHDIFSPKSTDPAKSDQPKDDKNKKQ
jgi:hypothetical protein